MMPHSLGDRANEEHGAVDSHLQLSKLAGPHEGDSFPTGGGRCCHGARQCGAAGTGAGIGTAETEPCAGRRNAPAGEGWETRGLGLEQSAGSQALDGGRESLLVEASEEEPRKGAVFQSDWQSRRRSGTLGHLPARTPPRPAAGGTRPIRCHGTTRVAGLISLGFWNSPEKGKQP